MKKTVLALMAVLALCGASLAAGNVRAYTTLEEVFAKEIFDAFEHDTGIRVEWVRLASGEAVTRIEAEKENPQASIWVGGVGTLHINAKNRGLTAPYRSKTAAKNVPSRFRDAEGYWSGLYLGSICFVMNTDRAKELGLTMPERWTDLLKPEYAKSVRVANPATSGTGYNVVTNIIRLCGGDEDKAFEFLKKMNGAIDQYTKSGSAPGKSCAIGEIPIAIGYLHDQIRLKLRGAPLQLAVPADGAGYETASMSILKNAPEPVEAKKLYDWILSEKGQEIISGWYVIPLGADVTVPVLEKKVSELTFVNQDDVWDAANKDRLLARWNAEVPNAK
ncbi:MAG: ABC transporter substrate-binding protein [Pyramidobacter sp.]|nr:ABC transporter substrate-binding protein [Pyramidobacter sp.]